MSTEVIAESTINRARRGLLVWCIVLPVGWAAPAVAGPVEDLIIAASRGDSAAVQALLDGGADVNAKPNQTCPPKALGSLGDPVCGRATALIAASFFGHLDVVKMLLDRGADVNAKNREGETALLQASYTC